jgi:hypothetical protein
VEFGFKTCPIMAPNNNQSHFHQTPYSRTQHNLFEADHKAFFLSQAHFVAETQLKDPPSRPMRETYMVMVQPSSSWHC